MYAPCLECKPDAYREMRGGLIATTEDAGARTPLMAAFLHNCESRYFGQVEIQNRLIDVVDT